MNPGTCLGLMAIEYVKVQHDLRHLLVSGAPSLSPELWRVATWSVARASRATLRSAQQLMVCFHADSDNFYGDVGQAKVAVRRDCGPLEADRLRQLCRQVFLLDAQRAGPTSGRVRDVPPGVDDQCSFIFLLHPPDRLGDGASADPDACVIRTLTVATVKGSWLVAKDLRPELCRSRKLSRLRRRRRREARKRAPKSCAPKERKQMEQDRGLLGRLARRASRTAKAGARERLETRFESRPVRALALAVLSFTQSQLRRCF
ncbi:brefeldin A-inhibited guanine nucleotide-exchange protein 3 [Ixodes scapularis]